MAKLTTTYQEGMMFETKIGEHAVKFDVPESMGGSDRAPNPPQYMVASLGACVAAFVANYCNHAGLDTTDLTVDVEFEKNGRPMRMTDFKVTVNLPHTEINGRMAALRKVAAQCPVHETMEFFEGLEMFFKDKKDLV